jgi:hypothetical protein
MKILSTLLIGLLTCYTVQANEEAKENPSQLIIDSESWTPIESSKKVGSGLIIEWEVPEDGTLFYAESTKRICFVTKSVKKGDIYTTLIDGEPDETLFEIIHQTIPSIEEDEVLSSLRFNLFFSPSKKAANKSE